MSIELVRLVNSTGWRAALAVLHDIAQSAVNSALDETDEQKALEKFKEARTARRFAFQFQSAVENTAQSIQQTPQENQ